tara:strand:- start:581 stop:997 length:417 start_codon:yes stop_codon:yes gene_type:complete
MAGEFVSLLIFPISNALERILWRASSPWLMRKTLMRIGFQNANRTSRRQRCKRVLPPATTVNWVDTARMKKILGISDKTLLSLKNHTTMFREGQDWRRKGVSARSPLQWNVESTEQAFTNWKRPAPSTVETFEHVRAK